MVYGDLQFFDIIVFAAIAVFLIYRLRSVLGKRSGYESAQHQQKASKNKVKTEKKDKFTRSLMTLITGLLLTVLKKLLKLF